MKPGANLLPSNISEIAKEVSAMSPEDKALCIEDIESELTSLLSIYSEEAHEVSKAPYSSTTLGTLPFDAVIHKVLEINIYTRESDPYVLVLQEDEEKSTEKFIRYIPLLRLRVFFPFSYPKSTPPGYLTVSNWLPQKYMKQLQNALDEMWTSNCPVVFEWVDYIQHNFLDTLDFAKGRRIQFENNKDYHDMMDYLIFFDAERDRQEFANSEVTCQICMRTMSGSNFIRLLSCRHSVCKDCYESYCRALIFDGRAAQITCFAEDCKSLVPDAFLRKTLPAELYERYETFGVNKALEAMEDIAWCPQCEGPAFKDSSNSIVAYCQECDYRFCIKCHETYHPFQRCKALQVEASMSIDKLKNRSELSSSINSALSNLYMNKFTKPCPKCKAPIIKGGGCNKMTCQKCQIFFCWLCLKQIQGYDHFSEKCVLFTEHSLGENAHLDVVEVLTDPNAEEYKEVIKDASNLSTQCPQCSVISMKPGKLNLITCEACKTMYCFFCGQVTDERHYYNSQCLKFS